uniref:butyrophilin subfamily 1 member A1-like n=1 Tax=Centroberyx gerrardi TaxID=166262 RepID=UPI003AAC819A
MHHEDETEQREGEKKTKSINNDTELQVLIEGERGGEELTAEREAMKELDEKKTKLEEELQQKEGERKNAEEEVARSMGRKRELEDQREQLKLQLKEAETQREGTERKLQSYFLYLRWGERDQLNAKKKVLETRKSELDEQLRSTETELAVKNSDINRMTDKKSKAENKMEQINVKLKETEKQRDEIERKLQSVRQAQVIGSPQPIVAIAGDDVILPCRLEPAISAVTRTVEWTRPDLNPQYIHVHQSGRPIVHDQNPLYKYRTGLFLDELRNGNVSLKLSRVKLSDEGKYRCFIPSIWSEAIIQLTVGAFSSPVIEITKNSSGVVLGCESKGWYPEPEVFWLDGEGNILSAGPTETVRGPDGLYTVSSRVTVEKTDTNRFTCRVQQQNINQTRETHIHVP